MAKPVLALHYCIEGIPLDLIIKNLKEIKTVASEITDYYVFVLPTTKDSYVEVFHDKDFEEVNYDELSKKLMSEVKKIKNEN